MGLQTLEGDEAFYFKYEGGKFKEEVSMHVDNFNLTGEKGFLEEVIMRVNICMNVSLVQEIKIRFTGFDDLIRQLC